MPEPELGPHERRTSSGAAKGNGTAGGNGGTPRPEVAGSEPARVVLAVAGPPVVAEVAIALLDLDSGAATTMRISGWALAVVVTLAVVVRPLLASVATARRRMAAPVLHKAEALAPR